MLLYSSGLKMIYGYRESNRAGRTWSFNYWIVVDCFFMGKVIGVLILGVGLFLGRFDGQRIVRLGVSFLDVFICYVWGFFSCGIVRCLFVVNISMFRVQWVLVIGDIIIVFLFERLRGFVGLGCVECYFVMYCLCCGFGLYCLLFVFFELFVL